jgi:hypothetical protein
MDEILWIMLVCLIALMLILHFHSKRHSTRTPNIKAPKPSGKYSYRPTKRLLDYTPYEIGLRSDDYSTYTYEELLDTNEWYEKRQHVLKLHDFHCDWCGTTRNLQVHHKYYLKYPNNKFVYPWVYKDDAFMVLCKRCHEKCHRKYQVKTYYRKY